MNRNSTNAAPQWAAFAASLLLLPVLFVILLPSLLFGGLTQGKTKTSSLPILNDNAAIIENVNHIAFSVSQILGEGIDDAERRIAASFAASDGDYYEIVNPYEAEMIHNTNAFVAQYCAAKELQWQNIALSDLERILHENLDQLFSFTADREVRVITDDPATEEDESETQVWYIYTLQYNREAYFADAIFHLSSEQKLLADDYSQNLSLFLGDGIFQGIFSEDAMLGIPSLGNIAFIDGATRVVYFNQLDERYAAKAYGTDHIGGYGCGPTAMSIVVSSLAGETVDPEEMAKWSYKNGYWCSKSGSYHALIPAAAEHWDLSVEGCSVSEPQRIVDALSDGKLVVALMTKGHFTSSGHFIVLRGVQGEKILVADPASYARSQKSWDLSIILKEASRRAGSGGPFWIIG